MSSPFSALNRTETLQALKARSFDLLIIGGGITGAGIALDAASRGLNVALVEKNDFAYGTSSRSTKLIHGGLRYLKQLEFGLVKEVGSERAIVHKLAPHLVIPEKMLLPLSGKRGLGYWLTSIGLRIYDWLAGVTSEDQRKMLTRIQTIKHEPLLRDDDIKGGAIYAEYRTDDARLTIEIIKTATNYKAAIINYVGVTDFIYQNDSITGVQVCDVLTNTSFSIMAAVVVNATGPWVDELRSVNNSKTNKHLHLTKGVHIVVAKEKLPVTQAIYFDTDDGRMIFAIPRGRTTYIGTTDTNYSGDINSVFTSQEDAAYLLQAVNATFPSVHLTLNDIESSWAGLRPLIHEEGKSASELSRKDEIFESPTGLISIAGGKLTGYRKMAERVVNLVVRKHFEKKTLKSCYTHTIKLNGSDFSNSNDVERYVKSLSITIQKRGLTDFDARYLVYNYGRQSEEIVNLMVQYNDEEPEVKLIKAEVNFCIHNEMVVTPLDFFVRRTGMLYFDITRLHQCIEIALSEFKGYFLWDDSTVKHHRDQLSDIINSSIRFKNQS